MVLLEWAKTGQPNQTGPVVPGLVAHLAENRGRHCHGAGRRQRRPESSELAARTGRGRGARGAPECVGPDLRCGAVKGSSEILVRISAVEAEGRAGEGHSVGCGGRLAVRGGDPRRRDARGGVGGVVPWPEVPVHVEALLYGTWIFKDAPRCGARA
jgi:hypothetical protein